MIGVCYILDTLTVDADAEPVAQPWSRFSFTDCRPWTVVWQVTLGVAIAAASVTLPASIHFFVGPDESWISALYQAQHAGMHWGSEVVFTYGPLGFLEHPRFVRPVPGLVALGIQLVGLTAIAVGLARSWSRVLHPVLAWLLAYVVVVSVGWNADVFILALVGPVLAVGIDRRGDHDNRLPLWLAAAAGVFALVKLSTVPVVATLALGAAWMTWGRQSLTRYAQLPLAAVATFGVLWLLLGQRISDIPGYVNASFELTTGYSQAMAFEEPGRAWEYWAAATLTPLVLAAVGLAVVRRRSESRPRLVTAGAVLAVVLAVAFRLGFVRHDRHSVTFFSGLLLLAVSLAPRSPTAWMSRRSPAINLAVALACFGVLATVANVRRDHVFEGPQRALDLVPTVADAADRSAVERDNASLVRAAGLPPEFVERIGEGSVHVEPYQTALVGATGLRWHPAPVFQNYAAFTPALDHLNATAIANDGPDWILRGAGVTIDGRLWSWDSPLYQVAVLCNYRVVGQTGGWDLLERGLTSRCGPLRPMGEPTQSWQPMSVPSSGDDAVLARVTCSRSRLERTMQALFKPRHELAVVTDAGRFLVVPEHLASPLLVRSSDMQLNSMKLQNCAVAPTVQFFAMAVLP